MKRLATIILALALPWAAHCAEEEQLIHVLQSDLSPQEKDEACSRLKWIGTFQSVPALANLLTNVELSHSARYALESMPGSEAENALRAALAKTTGSNQVGIINSLGARGGTEAVPDVVPLLSSADPEVAAASAEALGKMGGAESMRALQAAWEGSSTGAVHDAESDGLLACANRFLTSGEDKQASKIFQEIYDREKDDGIQLAAFRGLILSSEKKGIVMMVEAIAGSDSAKQGAALQLASKVGGAATTRALANMMHKSPVAVQIALLQCLDQRGDRTAEVYVEQMLHNHNADVRMSAITTLGDLGGDKVMLPLVHLAATATGEERTAAREALTDLRHGDVTGALLKSLSTIPLDMQLEVIRALGDRGDSAAAPAMLDLARGTNDAIQAGALQALASVAGPAQIPAMIALVVNSTNDDARSATADALNSALQHIHSQKGQVEGTRLAAAVQTAPLEAKVALLGVCSGVSDPRVREVLRSSISDADQRVRTAAIRAMCDSQDEQLLPDILKIACEAKEGNFRMLGIRGCVRLITQGPAAERPVSTLETILKSAPKADGKRQVLSGLATLADVQALDLALSLLDDAEVKVEAAEATLRIARDISVKHPQEATAALKRVLAEPGDDAVRKSAQAALKKIKAAE